MGEWKDNAMWRCPMPQSKTEREQQLEIDLEQAKLENLRREVANMNKEKESWQHYRIQAAIAAMPIVADDGYNVRNEQHLIAKYAVELANALIAELQKKGGNNETE